MSSASASPAPNPTRAQLRLVVLGQWIRAGLALACSARAGRGLVGGAVAPWQVFQAIRLAIQLAQRLSELQGALARVAPQTAPGETIAQGSGPCSDDPPFAADFLRQAMSELTDLIGDALGLAPEPRDLFGAGEAPRVGPVFEVSPVLGRVAPARGRPPDRPPKFQRPPRRRRHAPFAGPSTLPPTVAPTAGRCRLGAG
jgi:hypothetical protein